MRYAIIIFVVLVIFGSISFYGQNSAKKSGTSGKSENTNQPQPDSSLNLQEVNISKGSSPKFQPNLNSNFTIHVFATGLGKARDLQFSPGGALLVSDPALDRVIALPDKNNDGVADDKKVVVSGLNQAHGLAFYNNKLYVAGVNQVVSYNWDETNLNAAKDKDFFNLPNNSDHNLRTITFDDKGTMYVSVGSTCNVCNEDSNLSATVLSADAGGGNLKVFAKGLRNAPFIQINPKTQKLWGTEMGRDNLGDNIPPDEFNIITGTNPSTDSGPSDYGWPNCYGDKIHDSNFDHNQYIRDPCQDTIAPIFQIPAHSAPLGWTFINSPQFPADWQGDILVSYHGSWNRSTPIGYKVVHLKVSGDSIVSSEDFLTGFLPGGAIIGPAQAQGRPVDLVFDQKGNLYLSDDKDGTVYIIQKK